MAVELALTPDSRWGLDAPTLFEVTRSAGFGAVGLSLPQAEQLVEADLRASDLRCHELLALVVGSDEESTIRQAGRLGEAAERTGAQWVLTTFAAPIDASMRRTLLRCSEIFADAGAGLAAEFSPLGSLPSVGAAVELLDALGAAQSGVVIDTWHFFRGSASFSALEEIPLERIAYVQFNDAAAVAGEDLVEETLNERMLPGEGSFELERFATTLLERGWEGLVSVEVLSRSLRELPADVAVQACYTATAPFWR
jgi:sugar phosphate isomerase/epimerase